MPDHNPSAHGVGKAAPMTENDKTRIDELLREASAILKRVPDVEVGRLLGDGILGDFIEAIAEPRVAGESTMYEYLLANRHRLQLLALVRQAITQNYSLRGNVEGHEVFVSPHYHQWVEDGVIFLQGKERFAGLIGLYRNGEVRFGVAARDKMEGEQFGPEDFLFVTIEEMRVSTADVGVVSRNPATALDELRGMLGRQENEEARYQEFLMANPWMLGAQYKIVQRHQALDDANIPDFTATRARDGARDILEVKPPFMPIFTAKDGDFRADFLRAWDQCERYLDFTRRQRQYLNDEKGLRFENPHCYLIAGHDLDDPQRKQLARKQDMNPAITILTYNDLLAMGTSVVDLLKRIAPGDRSTPG